MLTVKFANGELVTNVPWLSMPVEPIQRIKYNFNGRIILMEGFESYNHLQEKVFNIIGKTTTVRAVYLMGLYGVNVRVIRLNLIDGSVTECETVFGEEYNGRPSTGWKSGILASTPQYRIV